MRFAFPQPVAKEPDPPGVTIPDSLVKSAKFASWLAFTALVYFLWLYTLDIAKDRAEALRLTNVGPFTGLDLAFYFPQIIGFAMVAIGIPYVAKISIPLFMSFRWKGQFYAKIWSLVIAVAVSLVVIAGTFSIQGEAVMEKGRDSAVAVEQIGQNRAAIEAQLALAKQELTDMMNSRSGYLSQAASVGAAQWQAEYVAKLKPNDPNADRITRALGAAKAADAKREEIKALTLALAAAPTIASVQQRVTSSGTGWIASTIDWLEGARAMLLALVMDIVCLVMPWIALRLEQARKLQMDAAAPQVATVDESHMIPHFVDQVTPQPMDPPMEAYDENGERLVFRKGHFAKKARKGRSKESDKPVPLSDTDPRVVRDLEQADAEQVDRRAETTASAAGLGGFDLRHQADIGGGVASDIHVPSGRMEPDGEPGRIVPADAQEEETASQETTHAERVLTIEEAEALVSAGTHAWDIDDAGNRFVRELEAQAQAKALPNGEGVMLEDVRGA